SSISATRRPAPLRRASSRTRKSGAWRRCIHAFTTPQTFEFVGPSHRAPGLKPAATFEFSEPSEHTNSTTKLTRSHLTISGREELLPTDFHKKPGTAGGLLWRSNRELRTSREMIPR